MPRELPRFAGLQQGEVLKRDRFPRLASQTIGYDDDLPSPVARIRPAGGGSRHGIPVFPALRDDPAEARDGLAIAVLGLALIGFALLGLWHALGWLMGWW